MLFSRINTIARRAGALLSVALALAVAIPAVASAQSAGGGQAGATTSTPAPAQVVGKSATDLTQAAANTKVTAQTIAGFVVSGILALWAVVCLVRKDFKEAAGLVALSVLAFLLITDSGQQMLQNSAGDLLGFQVPGATPSNASNAAAAAAQATP